VVVAVVVLLQKREVSNPNVLSLMGGAREAVTDLGYAKEAAHASVAAAVAEEQEQARGCEARASVPYPTTKR
jgi:hypothetical protein